MKTPVTVRHSAEIAALYQKAGLRGVALLAAFPMYSKATIYRHALKPIGTESPKDKRHGNKGRPCKVTVQDKRALIRAVKCLRKEEGNFTAKRLSTHAGVAERLSIRTVRRVLNNAGYQYLQSRKKGLLLAKDLKARLAFCRKVRNRGIDVDFWKHNISFYLDGKGFEYKQNPLDQARAPKSRAWRQKKEGLEFGCTAKGKKEGATNANFMVAISYDRGVVMCEQYFGSITGAKFADIVNSHFESAFERSINPRARRLLMDGCPRQNSKKAIHAIEGLRGIVFKIPARSPDLNPIENFFNLVSRELQDQALRGRITQETFEQFSARVKETMLSFPYETINNIIDSMDGRINMVIRSKGMRIRY